MFEDDPVQKPARALEDMSLEELGELITALEADIQACKDMIAKKEAQKKAADSLFGGEN